MTELQIYIFYLCIIILLSGLAYSFTENKMMNSLYASIVGSIISIVLWQQVGQYSVDKIGSY
jgi:CII-binding regulator of phage lambda lysogenization HflD